MEWISVKDALPEMKDKDNCLVSDDVLAWDGQHRFVAIRWKFKTQDQIFFKSTICDCCNPEIEEITHWMELPEPPKEGE